MVWKELDCLNAKPAQPFSIAERICCVMYSSMILSVGGCAQYLLGRRDIKSSNVIILVRVPASFRILDPSMQETTTGARICADLKLSVRADMYSDSPGIVFVASSRRI